MIVNILTGRDVHALIRPLQRQRTAHPVFVVLVIRAKKDQRIPDAQLRVYDRSILLRHEVTIKAECMTQPLDRSSDIAVAKNWDETSGCSQSQISLVHWNRGDCPVFSPSR
jgi:hypothetical protein